jgi:hypothetical protein
MGPEESGDALSSGLFLMERELYSRKEKRSCFLSAEIPDGHVAVKVLSLSMENSFVL